MLLTLLFACDTPPEAPPVEPTPAEVVEAPPAEVPPAATPGVITEGDLSITPVYHGTALIRHGERVLWLDPWSKGALVDHAKGDIILITDVHSDHMDPEALKVVSKPDAVIVAPAAVRDALAEVGGPAVAHVLENGASLDLDGLTITAVPMYNLVRGPESGGLFHDKGRGNGYLLTAGESTVYFAGDTECTDEMKALSGVDLAFLPMNLPYTMPPEEAAGCVAAFKPARVIPYHYAGSDLSVFVGALAEAEGVTVEQAEFYPGGLPW
ncbi:MAG: L-ascorbate metabolism protein UlaG (beta-lactamase superfamily) [Myxococcota bacterium]|jgi:L-ascorbate metabolism protein UlaG (beta-lactamase superfamily)